MTILPWHEEGENSVYNPENSVYNPSLLTLTTNTPLVITLYQRLPSHGEEKARTHIANNDGRLVNLYPNPPPNPKPLLPVTESPTSKQWTTCANRPVWPSFQEGPTNHPTRNSRREREDSFCSLKVGETLIYDTNTNINPPTLVVYPNPRATLLEV